MGKEKKRLGVVLFLTLEICIFGLKGSKSAIVSSPAAKRGSCVPVFRTQLSVKKKKKQRRLGVLGARHGTMPGEAAMATELEPSGNTATASPQKSFPFVLKKIMDIPPPNILEEGEDGKHY